MKEIVMKSSPLGLSVFVCPTVLLFVAIDFLLAAALVNLFPKEFSVDLFAIFSALPLILRLLENFGGIGDMYGLLPISRRRFQFIAWRETMFLPLSVLFIGGGAGVCIRFAAGAEYATVARLMFQASGYAAAWSSVLAIWIILGRFLLQWHRRTFSHAAGFVFAIWFSSMVSLIFIIPFLNKYFSYSHLFAIWTAGGFLLYPLCDPWNVRKNINTKHVILKSKPASNSFSLSYFTILRSGTPINILFSVIISQFMVSFFFLFIGKYIFPWLSFSNIGYDCPNHISIIASYLGTLSFIPMLNLRYLVPLRVYKQLPLTPFQTTLSIYLLFTGSWLASLPVTLILFIFELHNSSIIAFWLYSFSISIPLIVLFLRIKYLYYALLYMFLLLIPMACIPAALFLTLNDPDSQSNLLLMLLWVMSVIMTLFCIISFKWLRKTLENNSDIYRAPANALFLCN